MSNGRGVFSCVARNRQLHLPLAAKVILCHRFMKEVSLSNFGLLIAFVLPGFMVLWGASYFSETINHWLSGSDATPTVGGFMTRRADPGVTMSRSSAERSFSNSATD